MSETYETYRPPGESPDTAGAATEGAAAGEQWCVIVEYSNSGERKPPTLLDVLPGRHPGRADAMAEAERQAFEYRPPDPMSPKGRQVFGVSDGFVVVIQGAMSTFHIRVRAARVVGHADQ